MNNAKERKNGEGRTRFRRDSGRTVAVSRRDVSLHSNAGSRARNTVSEGPFVRYIHPSLVPNIISQNRNFDSGEARKDQSRWFWDVVLQEILPNCMDGEKTEPVGSRKLVQRDDYQ